MKRSLIVFILLLSLCLSFLVQSPARVSGSSLTAVQTGPQRLSFAGLHETVTVRRDERGIPYIEAANEADLYFAQGYVTASDRLWQMDLTRRTARGELAEIFGNTQLDEDKRQRVYGFAELSEAMAASASAPVRAALESYARGVNAFIASRDARSLPQEFQILQYGPRPWTPADSLLVGKLMAETLSSTWTMDLLRGSLAKVPEEKRKALLPDTSPLDVLMVGSDKPGGKSKHSRLQPFAPPESDLRAALGEAASIKAAMQRSLERVGLYMEDHAVSNNWVVSGAHTVTGKPLLANDPHLPPSAPSLWYMTQLSAPGLRVAGVTAPGAPGIILGHNERIAWGATNLGPDVQDLYQEKFDRENSRKYLTPAGWREADVRHEAIKVRKGFTDASTETVPFDVTATRHGPIILDKDGARYALRWTALAPNANEFEAFYYINRARSWDDFRAALKNYHGPTQNFVYADDAGHIGYYGAGDIPIRKSGDGSTPYDGSTDAGEWTSLIPFDKLPHLYDPPSGIIVTANQRIVGRDYPYFLTRQWAPPYRARRILDLLHAKPKLSVEDFRAIQGDTYTYASENLIRAASEIARQTPPKEGDEGWRAAVRMLEKWDRHADADSHEALLAALIRDAVRRRLVLAALGPDLTKEYGFNSFASTFLDWVLAERPAAWLPVEFKSYGELLGASYEDARAAIAKQLGPEEAQWTLGRFQQFNFRHPLARVPFVGVPFVIQPLPQHGSISSINVGQNVSMRLIADTGNWDNTRQGITLGESGDPASPHWKDQLADWYAVAPRSFPFTGAAVNAAAKETLVLAPATR